MNFAEDFFWVPQTEEISGIQVRCGIWVFRKFPNREDYYLQGLSPTGINELLSTAQFYKLPENPEIIVRVVDSVISVQSLSDIKDFLKEYLSKIPEEGISLEGVVGHATKLELKEKYFRQYNLTINMNYLEHLDPLPYPVLSDDHDAAFIPFRNVVVEVSVDGVQTVSYKKLKEYVVWNDQIKPREFNGMVEYETCHFHRFLMNISNQDVDRYNAFRSVLGYLMHHHSSPSKGQAVLFYDEDITNIRKPQGGTGKGLIAQALGQIRKVTKVDGKNYKSEDKFKFQQIELSTQIVWIDDPKPNFDFSDLFSCLTDGLTIEKKYKQSFLFPALKSPKFLLASNAILPTEGSSNKRRQYILELSNYYSAQIVNGNEEPIISEHGCVFFDDEDWDENEWNMFYSFMLDCIHYYLTTGLVYIKPVNVGINRLAQTTSEEFVGWCLEQNFETDLDYRTKDLFEEFKNTYFGEDSNFKQRIFTRHLKDFAAFKGWNHQVKRSNNIQFFSFSVA